MHKNVYHGNINDKTDFSGFESCPLRNIVEHRRQVNDVQSKTTQEERNRAESNYGARFSELLRLPYFDCIRFTVIDPMHNLFLGTAKHVMEIWLNKSILNSSSLEKFRKKLMQFMFQQTLAEFQEKSQSRFAVLRLTSGRIGL